MLRTINIGLAAAVLLAAVALFRVKDDTRRLDERVTASERHRERLEAEIRVLKAERALLASPERLEVIARARGLVPVDASNLLRTDDLAALPPLRAEKPRP